MVVRGKQGVPLYFLGGMMLTVRHLIGLVALVAVLFWTAHAVVVTPPNVKVNSDNTTELQNEQQIWINPFDANIVLADWRDFRLGYRRVGIGVSTDGGATWQDSLFTNTPYLRHSDPCLTGDRLGNCCACLLNYISTDDSSLIVVYRSTDNGLSWSGPVPVCDYVAPNFEDKQMTAFDRTGGTYDGNYYISWARFYEPNRIMFVRSTDGGTSFEDSMLIGEPVLYGGEPWAAGNFSMPVVDADGDVHVLWLGYRVENNTDILYAIRQTSSTDGGQSFGADEVIVATTFGWGAVDGDVDVYGAPILGCDISGGPYNNTIYFAQTQYGPLYFEGSIDFDIATWKSTDKGNTWDGPELVNDDDVGMDIDQFHPWLIVNQDGVVMLIFYDQRMDPVNHYKFDAYFAASFDGGETYIHNMRISDVSSDPDLLGWKKSGDVRGYPRPSARASLHDPISREPMAGRIAEYIGIDAIHDTVSTIWTDTRNGNQDCYAARFVIPFQPPRLYLPENGTINAGEYPEFRWSTCWHETQDSYRLEISTDPDFGSVDYIYDALNDNNFTAATPVDAHTVYYWRVKAFRSIGDSTDYSETFSFGEILPVPHILAVSPLQNEIDAESATEITATFDIPMDGSTIHNATFVVNSSGTGLHHGYYDYYPITNTAYFEPYEPFAAGEVVSVTLTSEIESDQGIPLSRGYTWSFTIGVSDQSSGVFAPDSSYQVAEYPTSIVAADLDNDGDLDLSTSGAGGVSVLLNSGDGTFAPCSVYFVGTWPYGICAADLDRDGDVDLATTNESGEYESYVSVLLNDGNGVFTYSSYVGGGSGSIVAGDLDGDGYIDLAASSAMFDEVSVLLNTGAGAFPSCASYVTGDGPRSLFAADFDGDYDFDLAVTNTYTNSVSVFSNDGAGILAPDTAYLVADHPHSVFAADLDADGDLDLVTASEDGEYMGYVSVLLNDGNGTFAPFVSYHVGSPAHSIFAADLNGDAAVDLVIGRNYGEVVRVLLNNGDGTFGQLSEYPVEGSPISILSADLDGDGDLDLAVANMSQNSVSVLMNQDFICGNTDAAGDVDIDDVVYIIAYIFSGGPEPMPYKAGDTDCSGAVDIDDVVYLIAYIFSGGPAPCDPDGDEVPDC